jgi:hypothetical protein
MNAAGMAAVDEAGDRPGSVGGPIRVFEAPSPAGRVRIGQIARFSGIAGVQGTGIVIEPVTGS